MKSLDRLTVFSHDTWTKPVGRAGAILLILAGVIALGGFIVTHTSLAHVPLLGSLANDFYANISTELLSIAITVLIIDALVDRRQTDDKKAELIRDLGSKSNDFALRAARELRAHGWHADGTLRGANLSYADLRDANLSGADLRDVDLRYVMLKSANLLGANLTNAILVVAKLKNANLSEADLTNANLRKANLTDVDLGEVDLTNANLQGANLTNADLWGAKLTGADLGMADLTSAALQKADLSDAKRLWGATLTGVLYDNDTKWPVGFDPKAEGTINADEQDPEERKP